MGSMNVLIVNVFNVYQRHGGWSGRLHDEGHGETPGPRSLEDVIDLSPKDGIWQTVGQEVAILEPEEPYPVSPQGLTYNSRGAFRSTSAGTGLRINLVV